MVRFIALASLVVAGLCRPAAAQSPPANRARPDSGKPPSVAIVAVARGPVVDGRLDDEAWAGVAPISGFTQREPREGQPATERTEVRLLSDGRALYVGAWLFDRGAGEIVRGEKVRDATLTNSDYFGFILDTYLDRQNGFVFSTTPAGIEYDGQVVKEGEGGGVTTAAQSRTLAGAMGGFNLNWDATWQVANHR